MLEALCSQNSSIVFIDENEIYFTFFGGGKKKRNVYELCALSKMFIASIGAHSSTNQ